LLEVLEQDTVLIGCGTEQALPHTMKEMVESLNKSDAANVGQA